MVVPAETERGKRLMIDGVLVGIELLGNPDHIGNSHHHEVITLDPLFLPNTGRYGIHDNYNRA